MIGIILLFDLFLEPSCRTDSCVWNLLLGIWGLVILFTPRYLQYNTKPLRCSFWRWMSTFFCRNNGSYGNCWVLWRNRNCNSYPTTPRGSHCWFRWVQLFFCMSSHHSVLFSQVGSSFFVIWIMDVWNRHNILGAISLVLGIYILSSWLSFW